MKTLDEKIYSILFDKSILDGVRIIHEDEWPIDQLKALFEAEMLEIISKDTIQFTHPDDKQWLKLRERLREEQRAGPEREIEMKNTDKQIKEYIVRANSIASRCDRNGNSSIDGYLSLMVEIAKMIQIEELRGKTKEI